MPQFPYVYYKDQSNTCLHQMITIMIKEISICKALRLAPGKEQVLYVWACIAIRYLTRSLLMDVCAISNSLHSLVTQQISKASFELSFPLLYMSACFFLAYQSPTSVCKHLTNVYSHGWLPRRLPKISRWGAVGWLSGQTPRWPLQFLFPLRGHAGKATTEQSRERKQEDWDLSGKQ